MNRPKVSPMFALLDTMRTLGRATAEDVLTEACVMSGIDRITLQACMGMILSGGSPFARKRGLRSEVVNGKTVVWLDTMR